MIKSGNCWVEMKLELVEKSINHSLLLRKELGREIKKKKGKEEEEEARNVLLDEWLLRSFGINTLVNFFRGKWKSACLRVRVELQTIKLTGE